MPRTPEIVLSPEHKRIVWHLRTSGPRPRIELANRLGIHNGALTRLIRELLMLGVVEEREQMPSAARGRPTVPLALSGRAGYAAGAIVHPGWLEIALVDFTGTPIVTDVAAFDSPDPRDFCTQVDRRLRELALEHNLMRSRFLGLGIAVPGPIVAGSASRRHTVKWLEAWRDIDYDHDFADYFGFPVYIENDATLAALAEFYDSGLILTCTSAIVFFVGHGVGGGVIHRREILRGEFGNSGDIGRMFPPDAPRPSGIDLLACLQAVGADIASLFHVDAFLDSHHQVIDAWVARAGDQLAEAAHSGVSWLDPGAIILSGPLPQSVLQALGERVRGAPWLSELSWLPLPTLHVSRLGASAAAVGAALLPIHEILSAAPE